MATMTISGQVIDRATRRAIPGLRVSAFDKDAVHDDALGSAFTGVNGEFEIRFDTSAFLDHPADRGPDVYFKVFRNESLIHTTEDSVMRNVSTSVTPVGIEVDADVMGSAARVLTVRGRVRAPDGQPVIAALVRAFDTGLRQETPLGETVTGEAGQYVIRYLPELLSNTAKGRADLFVRAYSRDGSELARSQLLCRAPEDAVVDLILNNQQIREPSEYEGLIATVRPYLSAVDMGDLQRDDVQFLSCSTGIEPIQIATLVVAQRLARQAELPDWVFYGFGRQGVRLQFESIVLLRRQAWKDALSSAIVANTVPPCDDAAVESLLDRLQAFLIASTSDAARKGFSLGAVLATSTASADLQQAFLARFFNRTASLEEFWNSLENDEQFASEAVDDFRFTLWLGDLTRYRVPVLEELRQLRQNGELRSPRDLASLPRTRWRALVGAAASRNGFALPSDITGETAEERIENYVTNLRAPIETMFPGDSLRRALAAAEIDEDTRQFLDNTSDLDLYWTNIDEYLSEKREAALAGIDGAKHDTVITRVRRSQRLLRLTRRADQVRVLDAAGFDSALAIARTPKERFRRRFVDTVEQLKHTLEDVYEVTSRTIGEDGLPSVGQTLMMMNSAATPDSVAETVYDTALAVAQSALEQFMELNATTEIWPSGIGGSAESQNSLKNQLLKAVPNLETLFGSQSFCECEHCRSVYSPAAYLVDLLHFLDDLSKDKNGNLVYKRPIDAPPPLGELMRRRPDLAHIPLTCENTNTALPYIDLVNEALESFIASHLGAGGEWTDVVLASMPIQPRDTGQATAEELRAVAQHVEADVYEHLGRKAAYPMSLPFHRPLEVARSYLRQLGTSRIEMMDVFRAGQGSQAGPVDVALVLERLGMCPAQYQIIAANPASTAPFGASEVDGLKKLWEYYGYASAAGLSDLSRVPDLLQRTGLSFDELLLVLKTRFLNPKLYTPGTVTPDTKVVTIQLPPLQSDTCDVSKMRLHNLDAGNDSDFAHKWLDRFHRFVRLWRALDWSISELDRALFAFGGVIDDTSLEKLAALRDLADSLAAPVSALAAFWADLDTWGVEVVSDPASGGTTIEHREASLYAAVFLNRAIVQDPATRKAFEAVLTGGTLAPESYLPSVAAALGVTADDIDQVLLYEGKNSLPLALSDLSLLYRFATLAGTLGLRMRDLLTVLRLVPATMDPFLSSDSRPALAFVRTVQGIQSSDFPIPLLNYLFRDDAEPTRHPAPTRAFVASTLDALQHNLVSILQEMPAAAQPLQETIVVDTLADALNVEPRTMRLLLETQLDTAQTGAPLQNALAYFIGLVDSQGNKAVLDLDKEPPSAARLMFHRVFKAAAFVGAFKLTEGELRLFSAQSSPLRKDAVNATPIVLRLSDLPISGVVPATSPLPAALFDAWRAVRAYRELRDTLPRSEKTLVDYFEETVTGPKRGTLVEATGWDKEQVVELLNGFATPPPGSTEPALPTTVPELLRLRRAIALLKRVGTTPKRLFEWAAKTPNHDAAEEVVQSVKARYERPRWLEIARGLNDPLREKQRNALVAFLLPRLSQPIAAAHPELKQGAKGSAVKELQQKLNAAQTGSALVVDGDFGPKTNAAVIEFQKAHGLTANGIVNAETWQVLDGFFSAPLTAAELLEYFLIDVEMSSCMLTSRIKQAIASVQLFVQRCLLNLEPAVAPSEIGVERWEWMKHYRIWEANRKVFLYPETYILPELRDDKTPFFKEFETELMQNELTTETVEQALVNYLYKLDEVARLDVRGFCKQIEDNEEIYHVVGRTWNAPYVYYYRHATFTKDRSDGDWTAWERIDLDIQSEYVIPHVRDRRVFLYWLTFEQKPDPSFPREAEHPVSKAKVDPSDLTPDQDPPKLWEIRLAWSEYREGKWHGAQKSTETIASRTVFPWFFPALILPSREHHTFRLAADPSAVAVRAYRTLPPHAADFSAQIARFGTFRNNSCNGHWQAAEQQPEHDLPARPHHTEYFDMGFRSGNSATNLELHETQDPPTLAAIQTQFKLLPTPEVEAIKPHLYSFFFSDQQQTYFARPVKEVPTSAKTEVLTAGGGSHGLSTDNFHFESFEDLLGEDPTKELMILPILVNS